MMTLEDPKVLVLRLPEEQGNFTYWMAELSDKEVREWKRRLAHADSSPLPREIDPAFGNPLTLNQVMERLDTRDFQVLDYPVQH